MSLPAQAPPGSPLFVVPDLPKVQPFKQRIRVGIDWSEDKQDWACVDEADGLVLARGRFIETPDSFDNFDAELRRLADRHNDGVLPTIAIETDKNLTVAGLRERGYVVYPLNPLAVSRYRATQSVSRGKSDKSDAALIANILRLDAHHRPMHNPSDIAIELGVLARAHQDAVWRIDRLTAEVRSLLRLYFPAALKPYGQPSKGQKKSDLARSYVRAALRHAPTPTQARRVQHRTWVKVVKAAGRERQWDVLATRIVDAYRAPALSQPTPKERAYGDMLLGLLDSLDGACTAQQEIETKMVAVLVTHPAWPLLEGIHGMGKVTAARVLGELGDDLTRFHNVRSVRAYAGTAPITRASGKSHVVNRRIVKNNRLAHALYWWAFSVSTSTPSGKAMLAHRKEDCGDKQNAALRNIGNRLVGCLWHCLATGEMWDDSKAWRAFYVPHTGPNSDDTDEDRDATLIAAQEALALVTDEDEEVADTLD
jgi:transposase